eukprot:TRINITY_DN3842_c0_g1_i3.p1 TRINITY_DN3842_c0_g1~~TRINITY_DN3842_c0_g1_i3.p1  ORF type:complete len:486 (+),score=108.91 TRINITY_DN3842_c0_g1_i3:61-1458(+)
MCIRDRSTWEIVVTHIQHICLVRLMELYARSKTGALKILDYIIAPLSIWDRSTACLAFQYFPDQPLPKSWAVFAYLQMLFSFAAAAVVVLILVIIQRIFYKRELNIKRYFAYLTTLIIIIFHYNVIPILIKATSLLPCRVLDKTGTIQVLVSNPDFRCWTDAHMEAIKEVTLPGVIAVGLLAPLAIFGYIGFKRKIIVALLEKWTKNNEEEEERMKGSTNPLARALLTGRTSLNNDPVRSFSITQILRGVRMASNSFVSAIRKAASEQKPKEDIKDTGMIKFLTLLYRGYNSSNYYWEFVVMMRGIVFVLVASFTRRYETNIKAAGLLIFCMIFVPLQLTYYPYTSKALNNLETFSLLICVLTAMFGVLPGEEEGVGLTNYILVGFNALLLIIAAVWSLRNTILNVQYNKAVVRSRELLGLQQGKQTSPVNAEKKASPPQSNSSPSGQKTTLQKIIEMRATGEII